MPCTCWRPRTRHTGGIKIIDVVRYLLLFALEIVNMSFQAQLPVLKDDSSMSG